MKILNFPKSEEEIYFEEPESTFEVMVKKNGKIIAVAGFEEEETAYDVLRYSGFSASETSDLLKGEWK